jgi:hypothetical protein
MKTKLMTADELERLCDATIEGAAEMMLEAGAPSEMILDRLLTYAGRQMVRAHGPGEAAQRIRTLADNIEMGTSHARTGEGQQRH